MSIDRYRYGSPENIEFNRYIEARERMEPSPLRAARILRYLRANGHVELRFIAGVIRRMPRRIAPA